MSKLIRASLAVLEKVLKGLSRRRVPGARHVRSLLASPKILVRKIYLRRYRLSFQKTREARKKRILIIMNAGIGNAVEATPLVSACRMHWPHSQIFLYSSAADLFDGWSFIDGVFTREEQLQGCAPYTRIFITIAGNEINPVRLRQLGPVRQMQYLFDYSHTRPEREYNLDMIRDEGYNGPMPPLYVGIKKPMMAISFGSPTICILPGGKGTGGWRHKRWPYYTELIEALIQAHPAAIILIIRTSSDELVCPDSDRVFDLCDSLALSESAWVMKHCDAVIGNDCGPMHIADAVQVPGLVLFGPTCEIKNGPWHCIKPLTHKIAGRPCQYSPRMHECKDAKCMKGIKVERVVQELKQVLEFRHQTQCGGRDTEK